jgi:hypothetical protein
MNESKFWRVVAVAFVVALLYIGYGLHSRSGDGFPSLVNSAHAGGVGVVPGGKLFTSSADGQTLFVWAHDSGGVRCVGMATAAIEGVDRASHVRTYWHDARDPVKPPSAPNDFKK